MNLFCVLAHPRGVTCLGDPFKKGIIIHVTCIFTYLSVHFVFSSFSCPTILPFQYWLVQAFEKNFYIDKELYWFLVNLIHDDDACDKQALFYEAVFLFTDHAFIKSFITCMSLTSIEVRYNLDASTFDSLSGGWVVHALENWKN